MRLFKGQGFIHYGVTFLLGDVFGETKAVIVENCCHYLQRCILGFM